MIIQMGVEHVCCSGPRAFGDSFPPEGETATFHVVLSTTYEAKNSRTLTRALRWVLTWDIEGAAHPLDTDTETLEPVSAPLVEVGILYCPWCGANLTELAKRLNIKRSE